MQVLSSHGMPLPHKNLPFSALKTKQNKAKQNNKDSAVE
jgi:hypothetical protein